MKPPPLYDDLNLWHWGCLRTVAAISLKTSEAHFLQPAGSVQQLQLLCKWGCTIVKLSQKQHLRHSSTLQLSPPTPHVRLHQAQASPSLSYSLQHTVLRRLVVSYCSPNNRGCLLETTSPTEAPISMGGFFLTQLALKPITVSFVS